MGEGKDSLRARFAAELRANDTARELRSLALSMVHNPETAKDLVQASLLAAYDPKASPWDPDGGTSFRQHMTKLIVGMALNDSRRFFAQRVLLDGGATVGDATSAAPAADDQLAAMRLAEWARAIQRKTLAALEKDDPRAARVYKALLLGIEGHDKIARKARVEPEEVRDAYNRIKYHSRRIAEEEEERAQQAMRQRRTAHAEGRNAEARP